jgi:hypothetical protein
MNTPSKEALAPITADEIEALKSWARDDIEGPPDNMVRQWISRLLSEREPVGDGGVAALLPTPGPRKIPPMSDPTKPPAVAERKPGQSGDTSFARRVARISGQLAKLSADDRKVYPNSSIARLGDDASELISDLMERLTATEHIVAESSVPSRETPRAEPVAFRVTDSGDGLIVWLQFSKPAERSGIRIEPLYSAPSPAEDTSARVREATIEECTPSCRDLLSGKHVCGNI